MNKKIKIIDLMQKCANKENIPERILYKNTAFVLNDCKCYYNEEKDERLLDYIIPTFSNLNEEVEILEDNTEEIEELDEWITKRNGEVTQQEGKRLEMCYKIDELVKAVNQIRKDLNK